MNTKLSELISPSFYELHKQVKAHSFTHYWLKGGRGSTKSSFISIEIILGMMKDTEANAVVAMKTKDSLRSSVYEQLLWAIDMLGVEKYWDAGISPLRLTYKPTAQRIEFRGCDNPKKTKGAMFSKGRCKYIWFEELDMFAGAEDIRTLLQTFMRGGTGFQVFYSYNPPKSSRAWVNAESKIPQDNKITHHSDYTDVPTEWLGEEFIIEAEHLQQVNETAYNHEYLGEEVGTGTEIFNNISITSIDTSKFDNYRYGVDWGYAIDPAVWAELNYDKTRRTLYITDEIYGLGLSNRVLSGKIKDRISRELIIADSAEPKSIDECREYGLNIIGAKKGKGSIEFGIKWLQDLERIIIDGNKCPLAAKEFINYSLDVDTRGNIVNKYPDKDNHTIDSIRYAMQYDMVQNSWGFDT